MHIRLLVRFWSCLRLCRSSWSHAMSYVTDMLWRWINAFVYMVMGRMIYFYIPDQQIYGIKAIKLAKIFVWLDVL
jgi:hypothetical protein